jgi:hypothetical protein
MGTDTGAGIIIAYLDDTDGIPRIFGQLAQVIPLPGLRKGAELFRHIQVSPDNPVDLSLQGLNFLIGQRPMKVIIALGFFLLNVGAEAAIRLKQAPHGLVEDMLGSMHDRVNGLFHFPEKRTKVFGWRILILYSCFKRNPVFWQIEIKTH